MNEHHIVPHLDRSTSLTVGDILVGPSALHELAVLILTDPDTHDERWWIGVCQAKEVFLYKVINISAWRFLFWTFFRKVKVLRLPDEHAGELAVYPNDYETGIHWAKIEDFVPFHTKLRQN